MDKIKLKKPKTFQEQVELIKEKGFIIDDEKECINFIKKANYYRLSAYYLPFQDRNKKYFSGVSFKRIQKIYEFDQKLRILIFETVEEIEFYLRTQLAYYHSHCYGEIGYLEESSFKKTHDHKEFLKHIDSCIRDNSKTLVVKHHVNNYNNMFPLWVIIEFFSMGMLSYFYRDLHTKDQKVLAREIFDTQPKYLESWLKCLTELRNRCAHYSRIYYWLFISIPKIPPSSSYVAGRRVFAQLVMLKYLYPDKEEWKVRFLNPLKSLINIYEPYISLKHLDFPSSWERFLEP